MMWSAFEILLAYGLGSISGSLVLGRLRGLDIRGEGSGNAGGTNALRVAGWRFALAVVLIDIGKGVVAAAAVPLLGPGPAVNALWCALAAVAGHIWPAWHGFRGGKGGATAVGGLAVVLPLALLPLVTVWLLTLGITGYVGLATCLAALSIVPAAFWLAPPAMLEMYLAFSVTLAAMVLFAHRSNLMRLARGTENRFDRARVLHPGRPRR
jgi:glycerol-3-phosphate acyltransferase PlsY